MKRKKVEIPEKAFKEKEGAIYFANEELGNITSREELFDKEYGLAELTPANPEVELLEEVEKEIIPVHLRGYPLFYGGYAEHVRNVLFGLDARPEFDVLLTPNTFSSVDVDPITYERIKSYCKKDDFDIENSIYLGIDGPGWFQETFTPKNGRYTIAWTMIESREAQPRVHKWLENVDEVWAPTHTDVRRFRGHNVVRMPLGYDNIMYNTYTEPYKFAQTKGRYVFGVVGTWSKRKGTKEIVQAYCREFTSKDPVVLFMFCKYGIMKYKETEGFCGGKPRSKNSNRWNLRWEFNQVIEEIGIPKDKLPHIVLLDVPVHKYVMPHIVAGMDAIVGLSRGESTWLPGIECLALGKPIIQLASDCSGFMDYLQNNEAAFLCEDVKYEIADERDIGGASDFYAGEELATGNVEELMSKMREVYELSEDERKNVKQAAIESVKDWNWNDRISRVAERLKQIKNG